MQELEERPVFQQDGGLNDLDVGLYGSSYWSDQAQHMLSYRHDGLSVGEELCV
jgi:hypothetical protein